MQKTILIVEDDEEFSTTLSSNLKKLGYNTLHSSHGKEAIDTITKYNIDIVLSDIQMPIMNGIELLKWTKENKPELQFIMMTGFSELLETYSAYELGANEFLSKPFKIKELSEILQKLTLPKEQFLVVESISEYCKISIDEFVFGKTLEFDIYIKLSEKKYVKMAHKGDEIPKERIVHYKNKGVKHLYVTKEGFGQLLSFNLNLVKILEKNKNVSLEKKINFIKYTGEIVLNKAFIVGLDRELFNEAQDFIGTVINIVTDSSDILNLLSLFNEHSNYIYGHSITVAIYSYMIAQKKGFESQHAFLKLTLAAIFHDIGKKEIDSVILFKHRTLLTAEEIKLIESHPLRGQEILFSLKGIPEDVAQLVFEHHEDYSGLGYPHGKKDKEQHPLSKILQLANLFVHTAMKGPNHEGMNPLNAIKHIEEQHAGRYDKKTLLALKSLINENA